MAANPSRMVLLDAEDLADGIPELNTVSAEPGARFVLHVPGRMSREAGDRFLGQWQIFWSGSPTVPMVLIIDGGAKLEKIT